MISSIGSGARAGSTMMMPSGVCRSTRLSPSVRVCADFTSRPRAGSASFADIQFFVGKGAGAYPTASAVLSDISALSYDYRYEYKKLNETEKLNSDADVLLKIFLRHDLAYSSEFKKYFETINECYVNHDSGYIVGAISLENLKKISSRINAESSIILIDTIMKRSKNKSDKKAENEYALVNSY